MFEEGETAKRNKTQLNREKYSLDGIKRVT